MICPNCRQNIPDRAVVCGYCGTNLAAGAARSPIRPANMMPVWVPQPARNQEPITSAILVIFGMLLTAAVMLIAYLLLRPSAASSSQVADRQVAPVPQQIQAQPISDLKSDGGESAPAANDILCNASKFVSETIPDGTTFKPGESFAKTWTLRNVGSCKWDENYSYEFEEGTRMGGESAIKLNTVIEPNETVTFKVNLKAPDAAGTYIGVWRLKSSTGEKLGKYWVEIKVGTAAAEPPQKDPAQATKFAVTGVNLVNVIFPDPDQMVCPYDAKAVFAITTNGEGTVNYRIMAQGNPGDLLAVKFFSASTKNVEATFKVTQDGLNFVSLFIDSPNNQQFGPYDIHAICN